MLWLLEDSALVQCRASTGNQPLVTEAGTVPQEGSIRYLVIFLAKCLTLGSGNPSSEILSSVI